MLFACSLDVLHLLTVQQRCSGGGGEVVNDYWVDSRGGLVWKSRQWAGPQIGYIRFRRLTTG